MIHFAVASQYHSSGTSGIYPSYSPKIGDIVYAKYNDKFYEVNMVKAEDNIFLQGKHTWTLQLIEFKNKGYLVSEELFNLGDYITTSASGVNVQDIYALNDIIDEEKKNFLYEPGATECSPKDPFNSWWTDRI
jgi:hypothetical protein